MDKKTLNNEIILCRKAVRKARVAIIRKIIKKMKILKSCKNEALKEKKLRKSERLLRKIQIIKKLKDDDITKFALKHKDLETFLKGGTRRERALASLSKHNAVFNKVSAIKERVPNWETELQILLDTMGKKKKVGQKESNIKKEISLKYNKSKELIPLQKTKENAGRKIGQFLNANIKEKVVKSPIVNKDETNENEDVEDLKAFEISSQYNIDKHYERTNQEEKIDDPFFIQKKIIIPKLLKEKLGNKYNNNNNNYARKKFHTKNDSFMFNSETYEKKRNQSKPNCFGNVFRSVSDKSNKFSYSRLAPFEPEANEKLHPSWAAKKVQLIKPFEGKKIKFSDD